MKYVDQNLRPCCKCCVVNKVSCPVKDCEQWIDYERDSNCALIAVHKNGPMTLREIADRLGVSFVRIKQIQDRALEKINSLNIDIEKLYET
tara:strand:+ start:981 stop:1253 length:273 start_codon:yes stop_codon:yes gene_type:complete